MMYLVSPELYQEAAVRLSEAIDSRSYFSGSVVFRFWEMDCRLTASVIVCRERVSLPECECEAISDLVPVWWEFHTAGNGGEVLNDFDFAELKRYV